MEKSKEHFCWVKVVDVPQKETADDPCGASASTKAESFGLAPTVGGRPPGRFAGPVIAGWWNVDVDHGGSTTRGPYHLDYMPMLGDQKEASGWLTTQDGKAWAKGEERVFLMSFTLTCNW